MINKTTLKYLATLLLVFISSPFLQTQAATTKGVAEEGYWEIFLHNLPLIAGYFVVISTGAYLINFLFMLMKVQQRRVDIALGIEVPEKVEVESLWKKWYRKLTNRVPMEKEKDIMLDHNYDGIRELDNSLPPWWVALFYIGIFAGTSYFLYYEYFEYGLSSSDEYALEMEYAEKAKERYLERQANAINEANVFALTDPESLAAGKSIFISSCAVCHGKLGEGGTGPNMTDEYWLHGGDMKSIFKTVKYGVPEKGMIAWNTQMSPSSIHQVASYLLTLKGTNPPNGIAPQGEKME